MNAGELMKFISFLGFEVSFWVVAPCSLGEVYQRSRAYKSFLFTSFHKYVIYRHAYDKINTSNINLINLDRIPKLCVLRFSFGQSGCRYKWKTEVDEGPVNNVLLWTELSKYHSFGQACFSA